MECTLVLLKGSGELGNDSRYFNSTEKDSFLSLELDILGPLDESGQVSFGLNIVAHSEVSGSLFEERVCLLLNLLHTSLSFDSFTLQLSSFVPLVLGD